MERVRSTGKSRWIAACPAHQDRSPSLSIRELDDGRVLMHCFGGCELQSVLDSIGLGVGDLFPDKYDHDKRQSKLSIPARDLLEIISQESLVVQMIASDFLANKAFLPEDWQRLKEAVDRIGSARAHAYR